MTSLLFETKTAWRGLWRSPGFTLAAVAMLAAGLGLCLYVFGAIHSFLLRPLPFPEPDRLAHVEWTHSTRSDFSAEVLLHDFVALRREQTRFESFAAFYRGTVNLSGNAARPERYDGAFITGSGFDALRIAPLMGRTLADADSAPGAPPVVLIGYTLWQQRFMADPAIVGRTIRVNGRPATVVGVMPNGFRMPFNQQVWVPLDLDIARLSREQAMTLEVFGRLANGATVAEATAELDALGRRLAEGVADWRFGDGLVVKRYQDEFVGEATRRILATMFAAVVLVLMIACANVAILLLARAATRSRDVALRHSLGATRGRLAAGPLIEAAILALLATPVALLLAEVGGRATLAAIAASDDPPPFWVTQWSLDATLVLAGFALALLASAVAGLLPGLRIARASTAQAMRDGTPGAGSGRTGRVLVTAEIAMSVALLVAAGLLVRGVIELGRLDGGIETDRVLTARVGLFESAYPDDAAIRSFDQRLAARIAALPGVEQSALTTALPMANLGSTSYIAPEGESAADPNATLLAWQTAIDPGYFAVFNVPLLAGRNFAPGDDADAAAVVIVSAALAERLWPGQDPLGRRVRLDRADRVDAPLHTVVGVVGNVVQNLEALTEQWAADRPVFYRPLAQAPARFKSIVLRTRGEPAAYAAALADAVRSVDADLPVYFVRTMNDVVRAAAFDHWLLSSIFGAFGLLSLVLAAAGLYAVLAYAVSQRTREIGVRRALGASAQRIAAMVAGQGAGQLALGIGIGLLLALGFGIALSRILYGVKVADPLTFLVVAGLFAAVAGLAALVPTRRALQVEPIQALHHD